MIKISMLDSLQKFVFITLEHFHATVTMCTVGVQGSATVYHLQILIVIRMINSFLSEVLTDSTLSLTTSVERDLLQTSDTLRLNAATQL